MNTADSLSGILTCPECHHNLLAPKQHTPDRTSWNCNSCGRFFRILTYPSLYHRKLKATQAANLLAQNESSCFYHPKKQARVICDACGVFLCSMCDFALSDKHYCSRCLENQKSQNTLQQLQEKHLRYDLLALALVLMPWMSLVFAFLNFITAPAALYFVLRYGRKQQSLVPTSPLIFISAGLIALVQVLFWMFIVGAVVFG